MYFRSMSKVLKQSLTYWSRRDVVNTITKNPKYLFHYLLLDIVHSYLRLQGVGTHKHRCSKPANEVYDRMYLPSIKTDNMKQRPLSRNAAVCCAAALGKGDETLEQFSQPWFGKISPLFWRIPILLWATIVTIVSLSSFWGPTEKFLLYMTHWGLMFVIMESFFGIIVAIKKPRGLPGKK